MNHLKIPPRGRLKRSSLARLEEKLVASRLFAKLVPLLERATRPVETDGTEFVTSPDLSLDLLQRLFSNRICGVRVPRYCAAETAEAMGDALLRKELRNWQVQAPESGGFENTDVYAFGLPFGMAQTSDELWRRYFETAVPAMREIRDVCSPRLSPFDKFRLELDELWPEGSTIATYGDAKRFAGITRVMRQEESRDVSQPTNCHFDSSPILSPKSGLFSVNIYLRIPTGGELFVWNLKSSRSAVYGNWSLFCKLGEAFLDPVLQERAQAQLPAPIRVAVESGDLVLLNTGRPHAVGGFTGADRVSIQCFIDHYRQQPLRLYS